MESRLDNPLCLLLVCLLSLVALAQCQATVTTETNSDTTPVTVEPGSDEHINSSSSPSQQGSMTSQSNDVTNTSYSENYTSSPSSSSQQQGLMTSQTPDVMTTVTTTSYSENYLTSSTDKETDNSVKDTDDGKSGHVTPTPSSVIGKGGNFSIRLTKKDKHVEVFWHVSEELRANLSGFVISFKLLEINDDEDEDGNDDDDGASDRNLEFFSSRISAKLDSFAIHLPVADEIRVCIYAKVKVKNDSSLPAEEEDHRSACAEISHWIDADPEDTSNRFITGILASVVFLTPCVFILMYVIYLDRKKLRSYLDDEKPLLSHHLAGVNNQGLVISEVIISPKPNAGVSLEKQEKGGHDFEDKKMAMVSTEAEVTEGPEMYDIKL